MNIFLIFNGGIFVSPSDNCPWQVFQLYMPMVNKVDFLFGAN